MLSYIVVSTRNHLKIAEVSTTGLLVCRFSIEPTKKDQRTHEEGIKNSGTKCVNELMNIGMRFKNV